MKNENQLRLFSLTLLLITITNIQVVRASYRSFDDCVILSQTQCSKSIFSKVSNLTWEQMKLVQMNQLFVYQKLAKYQKQNNQPYEDIKAILLKEDVFYQSYEFSQYWKCVEESVYACREYQE